MHYLPTLIMWPWLCDVILSHTLSYIISPKEKKRKRKRNINNNLAVLPSHDNMIMSRRYGGQGDDICYGHMVISWRKDMRKSSRIRSFLFLFILIEFWDLYYSNIFLRVKIDKKSLLSPCLHLRSSWGCKCDSLEYVRGDLGERLS